MTALPSLAPPSITGDLNSSGSGWASTAIQLMEVDGRLRLGLGGPRSDRVKLLMCTIPGFHGADARKLDVAAHDPK